MERGLDREMAGFYRYLYIDRPSPINGPFWYFLPWFCMLSNSPQQPQQFRPILHEQIYNAPQSADFAFNLIHA
jgi:hypothetical protein